MYYLEQGLSERHMPGLGKSLGMFYAISMVIGCLGIGNMFQANQAAAIVITVTGGGDSFLAGNAWVIGLVMAAIVALVIVGGIQGIARVTSRLVPFMAVLYMVSAVVIIAMNSDKLLWALSAIIQGAFSPEGVTGGIIGVIIITQSILTTVQIFFTCIKNRIPFSSILIIGYFVFIKFTI